ncbi:hypothetical protein FORC22_3766 [Vibrio parahaemolyticus]|nr:hypothetical protein FORC22_3766 [Vibrio parahaemolyticus]
MSFLFVALNWCKLTGFNGSIGIGICNKVPQFLHQSIADWGMMWVLILLLEWEWPRKN